MRQHRSYVFHVGPSLKENALPAFFLNPFPGVYYIFLLILQKKYKLKINKTAPYMFSDHYLTGCLIICIAQITENAGFSCFHEDPAKALPNGQQLVSPDQ